MADAGAMQPQPTRPDRIEQRLEKCAARSGRQSATRQHVSRLKNILRGSTPANARRPIYPRAFHRAPLRSSFLSQLHEPFFRHISLNRPFRTSASAFRGIVLPCQAVVCRAPAPWRTARASKSLSRPPLFPVRLRFSGRPRPITSRCPALALRLLRESQ